MQGEWREILTKLEEFHAEGFTVGPFDRVQEVRDHLQQNLKYAKEWRTPF